MTDIATPAPEGEEHSDLQQLENLLDRILERRLFFGWAPKLRSVMLIATFALSAWCSGHKWLPVLQQLVPWASVSATAAPATTPDSVPGLDRDDHHH